MLIKDQDINKTRSCACKLKYLLLCESGFFFFFFFKWVGRAMGNETFQIGMAWQKRYVLEHSFFHLFLFTE